MQDVSLLWEKVFDNIQRIVDLQVKSCNDPDDWEDDVLEKLNEIKKNTKLYICQALEN